MKRLKVVKALVLCAMCLISVIGAQAKITFYDWKPKYMGEIHGGYGMTSKVHGIDLYMQRGMIGTMQGISMGRYGDIAIAVDGVIFTHYPEADGIRFSVNPYFAIRPAWPLNEKASVFIDLGFGKMFNVVHDCNVEDFNTIQYGIGARYKRGNISVGMQKFGSGEGSNTLYVKIGLYFGK